MLDQDLLTEHFFKPSIIFGITVFLNFFESGEFRMSAHSHCSSDGHVRMPVEFRQALYREDSAITTKDSPFCFRLESGLIGLRRTSEQGHYTIVSLVFEGEYFGDEALLKTNRRHDAIALTSSVVVRLSLEGEITSSLFQDAIKRRNRLEALFSIRSVAGKVAHMKGLLNGYPLSNSRLAEMVSASRERLSKINPVRLKKS